MSSDSARVSWCHTAAESRLLRALVLIPLGVVAGGSFAVLAGGLGVVFATFAAGNYLLGIGILLAFAFAVTRTAPQLLALGDREWSLPTNSAFRDVRKRSLAGASLAGVVVLWVGVQFGRYGLLAVVVGTVVAPLVVASVLSSEGELDAEALALTDDSTETDLTALAGVRRLSVGGYVVYRLSYVDGGATFATPRWVVVPRRVDSAIRSAIDAGVGADYADATPPNRAVTVAAAGLGVFFLGFTAFLLTIEPTNTHPRGAGVLWYVALVTGALGVLFVVVGARSG